MSAILASRFAALDLARASTVYQNGNLRHPCSSSRTERRRRAPRRSRSSWRSSPPASRSRHSPLGKILQARAIHCLRLTKLPTSVTNLESGGDRLSFSPDESQWQRQLEVGDFQYRHAVRTSPAGGLYDETYAHALSNKCGSRHFIGTLPARSEAISDRHGNIRTSSGRRMPRSRASETR